MAESVELSHRTGRVAPLTIINVPDNHTIFSACAANPRLFVEVLRDAGGDVEAFIDQFTTHSKESANVVLVKTLAILNKPENVVIREEWDELVLAFKQAKFLLAECQAVKFIGDYTPPQPRNKQKVKIAEFTAYSRMWLTAHIETEKMRGRRIGNAAPAGAAQAEGHEASSILGGLLKSVEGEDDDE